MTLSLRLDEATPAPADVPAEIEFGEGDTLRIGRSPSADWQLPDVARLISNQHCEIVRTAGRYVLHDLSTNGVRVNGKPERLHEPHILNDGDRFTVGPFMIVAAIRPREDAPEADATLAIRRAPQPTATPDAPVIAKRGADPAAMVLSGRIIAASDRAEDSTLIGRAQRAYPASATPAPTPSAIIDRFAKGLGLAATEIAESDPEALAEQLGLVIRLTTDRLRRLLAARDDYDPAPENPLESASTTEEALRAMFAPSRPGALDARRAIDLSLEELKLAQTRARQSSKAAIRAALDELDPARLESSVPPAGLRDKLGASRHAKLWQHYAAKWRELAH